MTGRAKLPSRLSSSGFLNAPSECSSAVSAIPPHEEPDKEFRNSSGVSLNQTGSNFATERLEVNS